MNPEPAPLRKRGRPPQGDENAVPRETILSAALAAFASLGYEGFSSRKLARALGVSHGLLNVRFGTKEQLWHACVDWGLGELADRLTAIPATGPIEERFRQAVIRTLLTIDELPGLLQVVNQEGPIGGPRLGYLTDTIIAERHSLLEALIAEGVAAGRFRPVPARLIFLMVAHGGGTLFAMKPLARRLELIRTGDRAEMEAHAAEIADLMLQAVLAS